MSATRWWWCLSVVAVSVEQTHCEFPSSRRIVDPWWRHARIVSNFKSHYFSGEENSADWLAHRPCLPIRWCCCCCCLFGHLPGPACLLLTPTSSISLQPARSTPLRSFGAIWTSKFGASALTRNDAIARSPKMSRRQATKQERKQRRKAIMQESYMMARLWMAALDFSEWWFGLISRLGVQNVFNGTGVFVSSASGGRGPAAAVGDGRPPPPVVRGVRGTGCGHSHMFFSAYLPSNLQLWRVRD